MVSIVRREGSRMFNFLIVPTYNITTSDVRINPTFNRRSYYLDNQAYLMPLKVDIDIENDVYIAN